MKWMLNNSNGKKDGVFTLTVIAFSIVMFKVLLSDTTFSIGGHQFAFGPVDAGMIAAVLTPTLGSYVARRYTDRRHPPRKEEEVREGE